MRRGLLLCTVILLELIVIAYLGHHLLLKKESYTASITPLPGSALVTRSDRLKYFYELPRELQVGIPDWLPYRPEYHLNGDRLNDRFDYPLEKPPGTFRMITLGDSWTFGLHVSTKDTYTEVLEDMLHAGLARGTLQCRGVSQFEVLNFGVWGYDIAYMVERLRLRGMQYDPDLVLPLVKYDDFTLVAEIWQPKMVALLKAYEGDLRPRLIDGVPRNPHQELAKQLETEFQRAYHTEALEEQELSALRFLSAFYRNPLVFLAYQLNDRQRELLRAYGEERGNTFIEEISVLRKEEKVPRDQHPSIQGHRRFAQDVLRFLLEKRIIPCEEVSPQ